MIKGIGGTAPEQFVLPVPAGAGGIQHQPVAPKPGGQGDTAFIVTQRGFPLLPLRGGDGAAVGRRRQDRSLKARPLQGGLQAGGVLMAPVSAEEMGRLGDKVQSVKAQPPHFGGEKLQRIAAVLAVGVSAHNFRKKRAFFVKGATVATKCINKSRTILKRSSGSSLLVLA